MGITAGFALLALLASASTVFAYQKLIESEDRLDRAVEIAYGFVSEAVSLSNKFGAPAELLQGLLRRAEQALDRLIADGADTPKLHHRKAQMLLNFALSYKVLGQTNAARAAQNQRLALQTLTARQPDNSEWQRDLTVSYGVIGDLLQLQGNSAAALENYRTALAIAQRLVAADAQNETWQHDLNFTVRLADLLIPQGDLEGALTSYLADLAANTRWAQAHPEDLDWQQELACGARPHRVLYAQENGQAIAQYREGLPLPNVWSTQIRTAPDWQQNLSVLHVNFGDARWAQGSLEDALASYQAALPIRERIAAGDRRNTGAQRGLSVVQERLTPRPRRRLGKPCRRARSGTRFALRNPAKACEPRSRECGVAIRPREWSLIPPSHLCRFAGCRRLQPLCGFSRPQGSTRSPCLAAQLPRASPRRKGLSLEAISPWPPLARHPPASPDGTLSSASGNGI